MLTRPAGTQVTIADTVCEKNSQNVLLASDELVRPAIQYITLTQAGIGIMDWLPTLSNYIILTM